MVHFLSTSKVAQILSMTPAGVTQLVRDKKLVAVSKDPKKGYRFARGNIEKYIWGKRGLNGIL